MKTIIIMLTALLLPLMPLMAQEANQQTEQATESNGPQITFQKTVHDYGEIVVGGDGNSTFEFTNTGNEPLILSAPRSSCGCTVPTWPRQPILPGESETIKVTYNTARAGRINKTVTINSNAKNSSSVVLRITGNVVNKPETSLLEKNTGMGTNPTDK
jgi:hypothetical protein